MGNCVPRSNGKHNKVSGSNTLHVISVVFNPAGFNTRTELYRKFAAEIEKKPNVVLWTVECLFPGQNMFSVTNQNNPRHIQLYYAPHKLWLKENLINMAISRLPSDWQYMAWVDGDIIFDAPDIAQRTINELQRDPVVQMFETVNFLGPNSEVLETNHSFGYFCRKQHSIDLSKFDKAYPHPGFAWAMTRNAYVNIGGLPDFSIVGNGDNHFAYAMIGRVKDSIPEAAYPYVSDGYWAQLHQLEVRLMNLQRGARKGPGFVQGNIRHMWHGDWKDRGYVTRWQCLRVGDCVFDPLIHLGRDRNGFLMLKDARFLKGVEDYFVSRKEDSKEVVTDHKNKHQTAARLPPVEKRLPGPRVGGRQNFRQQHQRHNRSRHHDDHNDYEQHYYNGADGGYHQGHYGQHCDEPSSHHHDHHSGDHHGHHGGHHDYHCHTTDHGGYGGGGGGGYGGGGGDVFSASNNAYC